MLAITSSVSEQIGQHIWTCRGTVTSFTSECQEIIGECTEEVEWAECNADQLRSHYISTWTVDSLCAVLVCLVIKVISKTTLALISFQKLYFQHLKWFHHMHTVFWIFHQKASNNWVWFYYPCGCIWAETASKETCLTLKILLPDVSLQNNF